MELRDHLVMKTLSGTERSKLNLARALITNPEVLVCQRPLAAFHPTYAFRVLEILNEFVERRGVHCSPAHEQLRRPRTLFFSADNEHYASKLTLSGTVSATIRSGCGR